MEIWKLCLALGKMLTYTAATEEGNLNVISLIKNHHPTRKSKDTKHGNLLHVASASDPKLSKLMGTELLQQHFCTLDSTTAPALSKVSQSLCCCRTTASPTKQEATGIRHLYPNLLYGST